MAKGTSFPTPGQQSFNNNRSLLRNKEPFGGISKDYSTKKTPNKLKAEMTLELLKDLSNVRCEIKQKERKLKNIILCSTICAGILIGIFFAVLK